MKILFLLFSFSLCIALVAELALAQTIGRVCEGTQFYDGTYIPKGEERIVIYGGRKYRCIGCGGCVPLSSGDTSYYYSNRTYNYSPKSFTQSLIMGLVQSFVEGFIKGLEAQAKRKQEGTHIEHERWLAEWKKRVEEQIKEMQRQYNKIKEEEFQASKQRLLTKLKGVERNVSQEKDKKRNVALRNLKCSYYWSKKAYDEDLTQAKIYSDYSSMAMNGEMDCPEDVKIDVTLPTPWSGKDFRDDFFEVFVVELNDRVNAALKLRDEVEKHSKKVMEVQEKIKELEAKKESIQEEEGLRIESELLEAKKELEKAIAQEKRAKEALEAVDKEIKALHEIEKMFLATEVKK